jgi:hypothetical protein
MVAKLNWRCIVCGMSAGRRTSVQRHIDNPNIHNGNGRAVPLALHRYGLGRSIDRSRTGPKITSLGSSDPESMAIRIEKEVENEIVREVARRIFNSVPKNDDSFKMLEFFARRHISRKTMKGLVNEYLKL